jgi:hypothetical protein
LNKVDACQASIWNTSTKQELAICQCQQKECQKRMFSFFAGVMEMENSARKKCLLSPTVAMETEPGRRR